MATSGADPNQSLVVAFTVLDPCEGLCTTGPFPWPGQPRGVELLAHQEGHRVALAVARLPWGAHLGQPLKHEKCPGLEPCRALQTELEWRRVAPGDD